MSGNSGASPQDMVKKLVYLSCTLNQKCGQRTGPHREPEPFLGFSVRDRSGLEGAIASVFQSSVDVLLYPTIYDQAAALLFKLANGHYFQDGNKRTAFHLCLAYLRANNVHVSPPRSDDVITLLQTTVSRSGSQENGIAFVRQKLLDWTVD
ncbi:type II toxin-antitoxin system death-on-curing family toxin [Corynebacterium diphtheriae]|nr:type II toxin-antitoxin system death-on-curing family toxin [Corynebacterium diphtheriae]UJL51192.1 type II toxin-antitoxin system death-on-curing family toxin [Corynebacterium diphtheriae]UJL53473.1 type II toxin-antitoxin system death-on-curing family toxin [Corynebacterium diphtheriae]UJL55717.1 type II toxin-antitoxin system death-on-curing family toxin [Corynebacterium diphtheriae]CAB0553952.1 type II toxin-antitoxin system death-on-curing family toxin [Corynebacterium diphtheriae]